MSGIKEYALLCLENPLLELSSASSVENFEIRVYPFLREKSYLYLSFQLIFCEYTYPAEANSISRYPSPRKPSSPRQIRPQA
ncbi:Bcado1 [Botrytis cinerea B05.10]|uniref:Bcado1 n=1 Tax=Botryotinia fuckeliana (strain B05.10) TaxID=332648 RepID=A0A384JBZ0_BOTFB|nr:Bcado1 [Botrytis cinerea B05.10]ATZ47982.1 Bcado1 [Botrytis cinerea B05.10]